MVGAITSVSGTQSTYGVSSVSKSSSESLIEQLEEKLQEEIDSGKIDPTELQQKLTARFGAAADGIVSSDGTVDFDKLVSLLQSVQQADGANRPAPPSAEEMVSKIQEDISSGKLSASDLQEKLTEDFGSAADDIVSDDGTVDYDKLLTLFQNNRPSGPQGPMGPGGGAPPSAEDMVSKIKEDITSGALSATDLQAKLTEDFGTAADGIVSDDGTVDYDKLLQLLEDYAPQASANGTLAQGMNNGYTQQNVLNGAVFVSTRA